MAEQRLDHASVGATLQKMGGKAVPRRVNRDPLVDPRCRPCRSAGSMLYGGMDRMLGVATREHAMGRSCQAPKDARHAEQMRRQHDVTILGALALLDADHHPA